MRFQLNSAYICTVVASPTFRESPQGSRKNFLQSLVSILVGSCFRKIFQNKEYFLNRNICTFVILCPSCDAFQLILYSRCCNSSSSDSCCRVASSPSDSFHLLPTYVTNDDQSTCLWSDRRSEKRRSAQLLRFKPVHPWIFPINYKIYFVSGKSHQFFS